MLRLLLDVAFRPLDKALFALSSSRFVGIVIDHPIFIIGVERSGTTLLYSILANHPDLYWLSRLDSVLPSNPCFSSLLRRFASALPLETTYIAMPGTIARSRGWLPPSECLPYWRMIFKWGDEDNYLIEDDRFTEEDVNKEILEFLHRDLKARLYWSGKTRLLFKQTGLSLRIRFLNAVFPDALFLHMIRDPIANFISLVRAKEGSSEKFWGIKIPGWRNLLSADKRLQAAVQIQTTLEIIGGDIQKISAHDRYLRIRYEDLCEHPFETMRNLLQFCGLRWTDGIAKALNDVRTNKKNVVFPQDVPGEVADILYAVAQKYGYD